MRAASPFLSPRGPFLSLRALVRSLRGLGRFLRSCVSSPLNAALTLLLIGAAAYALPQLFRWLVIDAVWSGSSGRDCVDRDGACWIFIKLRADQILYGSYPAAERWRVHLAGLAGLAGSAAILMRGGQHRQHLIAIFLPVYAVSAGILLTGGIAGLTYVPSSAWGGLMLTVIVAAWSIATALPIGLLLALARRSDMTVIAAMAGGLIDMVRGLPLVGVLFLAIVMFPLFVPPGIETDKLIRALIAFTLFEAATLAEVFRGGLQGVPKEQHEAGASLGLSRTQSTWLIVVPQAVTIALPGIVNVCITIIKETTIVLIVGLFDFLGVLQAGLADPEWLRAQQVRATAYVVAAAVFWCICFGLSRYSLAIEAARNRGRQH
ncbi:general L-amino acid transport system permease protein [Rhizobiales bacterium GAS113]|nr:general L-amino acid transport system permease protein [Rhizobiales bacterium GAS113]